jgi:hypothetical protein
MESNGAVLTPVVSDETMANDPPAALLKSGTHSQIMRQVKLISKSAGLAKRGAHNAGLQCSASTQGSLLSSGFSHSPSPLTGSRSNPSSPAGTKRGGKKQKLKRQQKALTRAHTKLND